MTGGHFSITGVGRPVEVPGRISQYAIIALASLSSEYAMTVGLLEPDD